VADDGRTRQNGTDRRGALKTLAAVGGAVGCGALAVPTVRFLIAPATGGAGAGNWIKTVAVDSLPEGEPKRVALVADHRDAWTLEKQVELGAAWLVRKGAAVVAWSTICPHLGCAVDKAGSGPGFDCPCHDSSFDADGQRQNGPSPRAMDSLATRVEDGFVMVQYQRFRQGTPEKDPI
jgi:cytochrome b6-f complex iron-sulfur subunit/menaquinol-cytochrome c reductase iron-sulfur subunit